jgi:peptidoglycan/LPS O-acetylase OafA/YrhL
VTKYRSDNNGLRAIAVVPVLLYHVGVPGFTGGFVGVDIFFVISGYLICGMIAADIRNGSFSLGNFYKRRILRILPAQFVMLLVTSILLNILLSLTVQRSSSEGKTALRVSAHVSRMPLRTNFFVTSHCSASSGMIGWRVS